MISYYLLIGIIMLASWYVSHKLKSKFKEYSQTQLQNGMSGAEIARQMLADHGITDVKVNATGGSLTDHFHPTKKIINLSESVYNQRNAAAAAVAAHECGHAVQQARTYGWLKMRSALVPVVSIASKFSQFVIFGGIILMAINLANLGEMVLLIGIILFGLGTLFSLITLPVEYDASNRALEWLKTENIVTAEEYDQSEDALKWAARTYVVSALGSLATLLYFIGIFMGGRD